MRSSVAASETSTVSLSEALLERASDCLARASFARLGEGARFDEIEADLFALANEAVRRQLEARLQSMADAQTNRLLVGGKEMRRHEKGEVEYHSLCGKLRVRRWSYRECGVRNGPTVIPLDLQAQLMFRSTPALSYSIAAGYAAGPMRQYEMQMRAAHRKTPPRATLERIAKMIGGCAAQDIVAIENLVRAEEVVPPAANALMISLDRTSVAMAEERPPHQPPNSRRKPRTKPYQRKPPHPFDVNWRMPYVGTVSLVDKASETLLTRKYHATVEEGPAEMIQRMMADVTHYRGQQDLPVVIVQDGAPELWNHLREALRRIGVRRWTEILDRYHVNERLAAAAEIVELDAVKRAARLKRWNQQLDRNPRAAYAITRWLERHYRTHARRRSELGSHISYLLGRESKMKYAHFLKEGLPIASGVVEGTCKSLINRRAKGSGQRWKQDGLTAVLTLRALEQSNRLAPFWTRFTNRFRGEISLVA
jgi:hypothetical protein